MLLKTNCSDVFAGNEFPGSCFDADRANGNDPNVTSSEIAKQIRKSLALGNSLLSSNNLADNTSTIGTSGQMRPNYPAIKGRSFSTVQIGQRAGFARQEPMAGHCQDSYPITPNYSTILPN